MKFKSVLLLAVAIGCGLVAMLGVQQVLSKDPVVKDDTGPVLVAAINISPGTPLSEINVTFKETPKSAIPPGAVTRIEEYEDRALRSSAVTGEFIMLAKLGEKGEYGASSDIPEGMGLATVPVNATKTHSGLLQPGDRVDIMVSYKGRDLKGTETILEYIEVFATDNMREAGGDGAEVNAKNVTFLVTPEHAKILYTAETQGTLALLLRSKTPGLAASIPKSRLSDSGAQESDGDLRSFLEDEDEPVEEVQVVKVPSKPMWQMTIYAGDKSEVQEFEIEEEDHATLGEGDVPNSWMEFLQRFLTGA